MMAVRPPRGRRSLWRHALGWVAASIVLGAVFTAYLDPDLMVDLANRMWACF